MSKPTTGWQPIDKLQHFVDLIEKMHCDTQAKITKLSQTKDYAIFDVELASIMHVMHRQSKNYSILIEQLNIWQVETRDLAKLKLIETALELNERINLLTKECQKLTHQWIFKTSETQGYLYFLLPITLDTDDNYGQPKIQNKYNVTEAQLLRYQQLRESIDKLFASFFIGIDKEAIDRSAKRLEISQGKSILLNTVHESNIFFDYCFYQYRYNDLNIIQHSFQKSLNSHEPEMLSIFETASKGEFAYLDVIEPVGEAGVMVYNRLTNSEHLMIDKGLNNIAKKLYYYTLVTHIMDFDDFLMTTGASIPVSIHTEAGLKVERRFKSFLNLQKFDANSKDYKQYVTDMYKICFYEDITGDVASPPVPFGEEALEALVNASNSIN